MSAPAYAELMATSNFSFLRGASHPGELAETAAALGLGAIAVTDRNTLAGVVRAHAAAAELGVRYVVGARLDFSCGAPSVLCFPTDRAAYGRLAKMLSIGQLRAEKGDCDLRYMDLLEHGAGQVLVVVPPDPLPRRGRGQGVGDGGARGNLAVFARGDANPHPSRLTSPPAPSPRWEGVLRIAEAFRGRVYLAASRLYGAQDAKRLYRLDALARETGAPLVATGDVLYHHPRRRPLQDVLTCVREKCAIHDAGLALEANAERHLKAPAEMARLFAAHPEALARTLEIVERCTFSLAELRYEYPDEPVPPGKTSQQHLVDLTWAGAARRYPLGIPDAVKAALAKELAFIAEERLAHYFLTVHDIVAYARSQGILCQGRGSAANSAVCFCLGVTAVDPTETRLLFERFVSKERKEPPDIDVDFEHERREEVIQYIYRRYGRERAAICATVIHYRPRSAVRDVCKAMGLTEDVAAALAKTVWGGFGEAVPDAHVREAGLDPANPEIRRAVDLAHELIGFPRHLSQHVGGFVLTKHRLDETVPIGNAAMDERTFIEWDKDDIDTLGLMKVDVLGLGMLTCLKRALDLLAKHHGLDFADIAAIPAEDPAVYDMLCAGDSVGVFQVESRAQMSMLPRLKPRNFYDLVIEVAIVRPGPIQGDMVHPYLRRRDGLEPVVFPSPAPEHGPPDELERILGRTKGVPLFQEQAMSIAIEAAQFSPEEANGLRRSMATFRNVGDIHRWRDKFVGRMIARGYDAAFAERCFKQIEGFGSYGFPESHAASFAKLVYASAWIKKHYPDVFCAAILNSQPMGFYQPAQLVRDARAHGVAVRAPDAFASEWDCTLEPAEDTGVFAPPQSGGAVTRSVTEGAARAQASEVYAPAPPSVSPLRGLTAPPQAGEQTGGSRARAVRLGLRLVHGLREDEAQKLIAARESGARSLDALARKAGLARGVLERIAEADAFRSENLDRRAALWRATGLKGERTLEADAPLLGDTHLFEEKVRVPEMRLAEHVAEDYRTIGLSLKQHPCAFFRRSLCARGVATAAELDGSAFADGAFARVAGLVLNRQRPGTAKNVMFATIEDETGVANLVVWDQIFRAQRRTWMRSAFMMVEGRLQKAHGVTHLIVARAHDLTALLARMTDDQTAPVLQHSRDFH